MHVWGAGSIMQERVDDALGARHVGEWRIVAQGAAHNERDFMQEVGDSGIVDEMWKQIRLGKEPI